MKWALLHSDVPSDIYLPQQAKVMIHRDNHQHCLSLLKVLPALQIFPSVHHPGFSHRRCLCLGQKCASFEPRKGEWCWQCPYQTFSYIVAFLLTACSRNNFPIFGTLHALAVWGVTMGAVIRSCDVSTITCCIVPGKQISVTKHEKEKFIP